MWHDPRCYTHRYAMDYYLFVFILYPIVDVFSVYLLDMSTTSL